MRIHLRRLFIIFLVLGLIILTGCLPQEQEELMSNNVSSAEGVIFSTDGIVPLVPVEEIWDDFTHELEMQRIRDAWFSNEENWYYMGRRYRELSDIPGIDDPVILVNELPVTRRMIESQKIQGDFSESFSLRESIELLIRMKVIQSEANRRGVHPSQDDINTFWKYERKSLEDGSNEMTLAYIKGTGETIDEYILATEEGTYAIMQGLSFFEFIIELYDDEIRAEEIRGIHGFYERYIDELVANADIEILDPEIKELFR